MVLACHGWTSQQRLLLYLAGAPLALIKSNTRLWKTSFKKRFNNECLNNECLNNECLNNECFNNKCLNNEYW